MDDNIRCNFYDIIEGIYRLGWVDYFLRIFIQIGNGRIAD